MKKRLLLGMLLLGGLAVNAQTNEHLPNGSNAPEISGFEVDGVTQHSLQQYLDSGKTVVVYLSASWCGPCWAYHNTHYLSDIYNAYGPQGSDELTVLYVEADSRTAPIELTGVDAPPPSGQQAAPAPQGDWIANTPYPIISDDSALGDYQTNSFPTMFVITPSGVAGQPGKSYEIERGNPAELVAMINDAMSANIAPNTSLTGVDHWGKITAAPYRFCEADVPVTAFVEGYGHGITSVQAQLLKDGVVVATETFSGLNLAAFETGEITFTGISADGTAQYQAVLLQVNEAAALTTIPENNTSEEYSVLPSASVESSANVKVVINTDEYPSEMKLYIIYYDDANPGQAMIAWQTPTYANTAANKEKTFVYNIDFTTIAAVSTSTCLGVVMQDSYGDGWVTNEAGADVPHGVTITSANGNVLFQHNGQFTGSYVWQDATFTQNGILANDTFETSKFAVYPNPSNGVFNFSTEETIDVTVTDLTGKTVHTAKGIENGGSINLSTLSTGMYIAKINGASGERVEKLIIK